MRRTALLVAEPLVVFHRNDFATPPVPPQAHVGKLQLTLRRFAELLVSLNLQEQRLFQCHCWSKDYLFDLYHILNNHSQSRLLVLQLLSSGWKQRKSEFNTTQDFLLITVLNSHL